jgi:hypothetical protein
MTVIPASRLSRSEMSLLGNNVFLAVSRDHNKQMRSRKAASVQDVTDDTQIRLGVQHDAGVQALTI